MSLQPTNSRQIDRSTTSPFLLRLFWRERRPYEAHEFSVAPPTDTTGVPDYSSLLPQAIRQQSVQIYTWPTCTLAELTGLLGTVLPQGVLGDQGGVGCRLVYKLIFPDTRSGVSESGRGKWIDKPLGSVVIGGNAAVLDEDQADGAAFKAENLEGEADKTLADARFVIGDYVACTIYPPSADGRIAPMPSGGGRGPREPYTGPRDPYRGSGPPPARENGFYGSGRGGGYRGGGRGGAPPMSDWRRGERPPGPPGGGYYGGGRGGGRPY